MREEGITRTIRDVQLFELDDHFQGGVASGLIGGFPWVETSSAAGTNALQAGLVNHPGVLRLVTGATSTNNKRIHLGSTASEATFTPASFDRFRWVVRIPTITTLTIRLGLMQDISAASGGTAGAYFEFDPAVSANWRTVTRQASTSTANNAVAVTANNWYLLEAIRHPSAIGFFIGALHAQRESADPRIARSARSARRELRLRGPRSGCRRAARSGGCYTHDATGTSAVTRGWRDGTSPRLAEPESNPCPDSSTTSPQPTPCWPLSTLRYPEPFSSRWYSAPCCWYASSRRAFGSNGRA
jgi:hypothetical protein